MADGQIISAPSARHLQSTILAGREPVSRLASSADPLEPAPYVVRDVALLVRNDLLQKALERLEEKSAGLRRILASIDIPIVCLCPRLTLRFFTAEAGLLLGITRDDIGAPLSSAALLDREGALLARIRTVLRNGLPDALEIETASQQRFHCRMVPLDAILIEGPAIDGVTLAFFPAATGSGAAAKPDHPSPVRPPTGNHAVHTQQMGADDQGQSACNPAFGDGLTCRQHQILDQVLAGHPSKNIAADLGISRRTVENHRAAIMQRTGATSLPALARMAIAADVGWDCRAIPPAPGSSS